MYFDLFLFWLILTCFCRIQYCFLERLMSEWWAVYMLSCGKQDNFPFSSLQWQWAMNRAQLFLSHSPVIGVVFKLSDNDNHLSISSHFIRSSNRILGVSDDCVSFLISTTWEFGARHQFHRQLEFCLSTEFSKLNILAAVSLARAEQATRTSKGTIRAYFTVSQHSETCS